MWFDVKAAVLEIEGSTPAKTANSAKRDANQGEKHLSLAGLASLAAPHVDISFSVNTDNIEFQEHAGMIADNPDIPRQWVEGMAALVSMPYPEGWDQRAWDRVLISAETFLSQWGEKAHQLGWSTNDVFGVSVRGSQVRLDRTGLVLLLGDKRVVGMTSESAALQCLNHRTGEPNGSTLTFYRKQNMNLSVPVWEVAKHE